MLSKKLITYLNIFSAAEIRKLEKFIQSPYHNEIEELTKFYAIIKPAFLKDTKSIPSKKEVWSQLFPDQPYNDVKIRKIASLVLNLAIEFKAYEILEEQPQQKLLLELKAVSHPNLTTHIAGINRKLKAEDTNANTSLAHFYKYEFNAQNHRILELENNRKELLKLENLHAAEKHLHIFFYAQKMAIIADNIGYQGFMDIKPHQTQYHSFLQSLPNTPYFHEPIIQVYYLILQMLSNPQEESHFFNLKDWLATHHTKFSKRQLKTFYSHLVNYCISHKINKGENSFYEQVFDVFKEMVSKQLIFDPFIDPSYYRNIITSGIKLNQFDYVNEFIKKYSSSLPPHLQENAETYNLARLYYAQKQYKKVLELLHNVELTNISYALGAKTILIGTYVALDEYRALESLLISFRIFILRNKLLSKNAKQGYLNFLKFTKKLISLAPYDKKAKEKLRKDIANTKNLMVRDWLLEQLDNI